MRTHSSVFNRSSQRGFALPISIGLGLIAVLIGLTAVLRAQDDRTVAANSQGATESELAASSGITQIQNFLNRYRMLANFNACTDENWSADGTTCTTNTGDPIADVSWANPGLIPNLNAACGTGTLAQSRTDVQAFANNTWRPVDTSLTPDLSLGEFRLINYENNGTLIVEGAVRRGDVGESRARISARLPIFRLDNEQIAGVWVQSTGTGVTGNPVINADVTAPCVSSVSLSSASTGNLIRTQVPMPAAPALPAAGTGVYNLADISSLPGENTVISDSSGGSIPLTGKKLPRLVANNNGATVDDVPDANGVYNYIVASIDDSFEIVPGAAVNIWVTSSEINLENLRIVNPCNTAGAALTCGPFDVRLYGTGNQIRLNAATNLCDVFVHLPNHNLTFSSAGTTDFSCGAGEKITSVFWLNQWSGANGSENILTPRATWSQALSGTTIAAPPPRIGQIQVWEPDS